MGNYKQIKNSMSSRKNKDMRLAKEQSANSSFGQD